MRILPIISNTARKQDSESYDQNHALIDLRDVSKSYKTAVGAYRALKSIDLQINAGEFVSVIAKSGSGKPPRLI